MPENFLGTGRVNPFKTIEAHAKTGYVQVESEYLCFMLWHPCVMKNSVFTMFVGCCKQGIHFLLFLGIL